VSSNRSTSFSPLERIATISSSVFEQAEPERAEEARLAAARWALPRRELPA
jgi:hypothetical protein